MHVPSHPCACVVNTFVELSCGDVDCSGVSARERNHTLHPTSPQLSSTWCTDNTCTRVRWNMHPTNEYHLDSSPIAMFPQPAQLAPRPTSRACWQRCNRRCTESWLRRALSQNSYGCGDNYVVLRTRCGQGPSCHACQGRCAKVAKREVHRS